MLMLPTTVITRDADGYVMQREVFVSSWQSVIRSLRSDDDQVCHLNPNIIDPSIQLLYECMTSFFLGCDMVLVNRLFVLHSPTVVTMSCLISNCFFSKPCEYARDPYWQKFKPLGLWLDLNHKLLVEIGCESL
jgi:hypothetical protein